MHSAEEAKAAMETLREEKAARGASGRSGCKPAILISHPTGNQNVRNALQSLVEHNMLAEFWTTVAWNPQSQWNRLLPPGLQLQLGRRAFAQVPGGRVKCVPSREIVRLGLRYLPLGRLLCLQERPFSVIGMYRHFDGRVARRLSEIAVDAVYAYEGGALQTFRQARRHGIAALYELTSSYWYWERDLLRKEQLRNPELASVLPKLSDSEDHMREKDEELALADFIVVASQHVRRTLAGVVPEDKILIVPYGAPPVRSRPVAPAEPRRPLRVLFAGALSQGKGIGYLLKAVEMLGSDVELTLIGRRIAPNDLVDTACRRWRWFETLPHERVMEIMIESDVLVLPSLGEGFGLVVTEALACGLPVIVTPNVGASDLVCEGQEGFVVPVSSAEAIADRLNRLNWDRKLLTRMSRNAQSTAARHSWEVYREAWATTVKAATSQ
ncbi:MAG: glycosyltransferase family 4 protein [Terracidiphilus sp.]|jgi:glycosyltransferase involved in cell wall biosynthesis